MADLLEDLLDENLDVINEWRSSRGLPPVSWAPERHPLDPTTRSLLLAGVIETRALPRMSRGNSINAVTDWPVPEPIEDAEDDAATADVLVDEDELEPTSGEGDELYETALAELDESEEDETGSEDGADEAEGPEPLSPLTRSLLLAGVLEIRAAGAAKSNPAPGRQVITQAGSKKFRLPIGATILPGGEILLKGRKISRDEATQIYLRENPGAAPAAKKATPSQAAPAKAAKKATPAKAAKATPAKRAARPAPPTTGADLRDTVTKQWGEYVPAIKPAKDGQKHREPDLYRRHFRELADKLAAVDPADPAALRAAAREWRDEANQERGVSSMRAGQPRGTFHYEYGTAGLAAADQYENVADYLDQLAAEPRVVTPAKVAPAKKATPAKTTPAPVAAEPSAESVKAKLMKMTDAQLDEITEGRYRQSGKKPDSSKEQRIQSVLWDMEHQYLANGIRGDEMYAAIDADISAPRAQIRERLALLAGFEPDLAREFASAPGLPSLNAWQRARARGATPRKATPAKAATPAKQSPPYKRGEMPSFASADEAEAAAKAEMLAGNEKRARQLFAVTATMRKQEAAKATPASAGLVRRPFPASATDAESRIAHLRSINTREQAADAVDELSKSDLVGMARELSVPGVSSKSATDLRRDVVQATVGRRLDSIATRGFAGPSPSDPGESADEFFARTRREAGLSPAPDSESVKAAWRNPATPAKATPASADEVRERLRGMTTRAEAEAYIKSLGLTKPQLQRLADHVGASPASGDSKDSLVDKIVGVTVGGRADSAAMGVPPIPRAHLEQQADLAERRLARATTRDEAWDALGTMAHNERVVLAERYGVPSADRMDENGLRDAIVDRWDRRRSSKATPATATPRAAKPDRGADGFVNPSVVRERITSTASAEEASAYLDSLGMSQAEARRLARELGVSGSSAPMTGSGRAPRPTRGGAEKADVEGAKAAILSYFADMWNESEGTPAKATPTQPEESRLTRAVAAAREVQTDTTSPATALDALEPLTEQDWQSLSDGDKIRISTAVDRLRGHTQQGAPEGDRARVLSDRIEGWSAIGTDSALTTARQAGLNDQDANAYVAYLRDHPGVTVAQWQDMRRSGDAAGPSADLSARASSITASELRATAAFAGNPTAARSHRQTSIKHLGAE